MLNTSSIIQQDRGAWAVFTFIFFFPFIFLVVMCTLFLWEDDLLVSMCLSITFKHDSAPITSHERQTPKKYGLMLTHKCIESSSNHIGSLTRKPGTRFHVACIMTWQQMNATLVLCWPQSIFRKVKQTKSDQKDNQGVIFTTQKLPKIDICFVRKDLKVHEFVVACANFQGFS